MSVNNIACFCTELERFYLSTIMTLNYGLHNGDYQNLYTFISLTDSSDTSNTVIKNTKELKNAYANIIAMKKNSINDISLVVERIDWAANTFYEKYDQETNMGAKNAQGKLIRKFYVKNKYDQVFKCLWNNTTLANSVSIQSISNHNTHISIAHSGSTFDLGSYITLSKVDPSEYNGTYKVVGSNYGIANVSIGNTSSEMVSSYIPYVSGGNVKSAILTSEEPYFDVGTFDEEYIIQTADGYKWKYIYTLDRASKLKFYDDNWMPIPVTINYPNPYNSVYGCGSIDSIDVINPGSDYSNGVGTVNINIVGDGTGATAEALVVSNTIQSITVTNPGRDYTYANVQILPAVGYFGSGAETYLTVSPIGGHGFDVARELTCQNVLVSTGFEGSENGKLPENISFNQIGLMFNPYVLSDLENHANTSFISRIITITVSSGGSYLPGETVTQEDIFGTVQYIGKVIQFDSSNNVLSVINSSGSIQRSKLISGSTSGSSTLVASFNASDYVPYSGNIFYIENRAPIERVVNGIDQVRILLNYNQ